MPGLCRRGICRSGPSADHTPPELPVQAYVGDDLVYLADEYIGSCGVLYVPSATTLIRLGSYTSLDNFLWAFQRGLTLVGHTQSERPNTLTITAVHALAATVASLSSLLRRPVLETELAALPAHIEAGDLYFDIPALREMEEAGVCDFRLNVTEGEPPPEQSR